MTTRIFVATALVAALGLAAPDEKSRNRIGTGDPQMDAFAPSDRNFVMKAAQGGIMEVQLAQIAQKNASSDQVKALAQRIEKDHTTANTELKTIADNRGFKLPTELPANMRAHVDKMSRMNGAEFDRHYTRMMVREHRKDISDFERASTNAMDSELKAFATKTLPNLREHLQMAQAAQGGGKTAAAAGPSR